LIGIAISGTALAVKVKILMDMGLLHSRVGYVMMGASVTDNILSFIILTAVLKAITVGVTPLDIGISVVEVALFFAVVLIVGYFVYPKIKKVVRGEMMAFALVLILGFLFAPVGEQIGIHFIIGAYLAGLFVREELQEREFKKVDVRFETLAYGFFAPIFIVSVAFHVNLGVFTTEFLFLTALTLAAVIGKLIGAGGGGYLTGLSKDEALTVGIGMNARGVVEIILVVIGVELGILTDIHLTLLVAVAFITTFITPAWLRYRLIK
jgi:Kef-type K+ transport system membrane component KefB